MVGTLGVPPGSTAAASERYCVRSDSEMRARQGRRRRYRRADQVRGCANVVIVGLGHDDNVDGVGVLSGREC